MATGNREPDPQKETVLFLHGTGQDHTIWVLPTRYFARHDRNVLAVDLPGHGRSGGKPLESIEAMADWAIQVLDAAGLSMPQLSGTAWDHWSPLPQRHGIRNACARLHWSG